MNKDRRKRQGAALVEGLIAASSILILFGATLFFHDMFRSKGATMRDTRHYAWTGTRPGCDQFSDIQHEQSATVVLPSTLIRKDAPTTITVQSTTAMECNVKPEPGDGALDALSSLFDVWK